MKNTLTAIRKYLQKLRTLK